MVVIRPGRFVEKRIPDIASLYPILQKTYVGLRSWDFPHLDSHSDHNIYMDWIGQQFDRQHYISLWRFYQSGQFFHISGMGDDWRDQSTFWPPSTNWKPKTSLGIVEAIITFSEIFEFSSRLSLSEAGDDLMHIEITVGNLAGRRLYCDSSRRMPLIHEHRASLEKFSYPIDVNRSDLVAKSRDMAVNGANELFKRFDWTTTPELLRGWQDETPR